MDASRKLAVGAAATSAAIAAAFLTSHHGLILGVGGGIVIGALIGLIVSALVTDSGRP